MFSFRNTDLPQNRELLCTLQNIKGVGWHKSIFMCSRLGFGYPFFFTNLNFYKFSLILFLLRFLVRSDSKVNRILSSRIRELIVLQTYRGFRHSDFLPVRGQRTRSNANVRKNQKFTNRSF
jgi:small subunit ribosomal protein S13